MHSLLSGMSLNWTPHVVIARSHLGWKIFHCIWLWSVTTKRYQVIQLQEGECMVSNDVKALLTLVQRSPAISNQKQTMTGPPNSQQDLFVPQHLITLLEVFSKYLYPSCRVIIMNRSMVQPWVPHQSPSRQPVHGRVWIQGHQHCPESTQAVA